MLGMVKVLFMSTLNFAPANRNRQLGFFGHLHHAVCDSIANFRGFFVVLADQHRGQYSLASLARTIRTSVVLDKTLVDFAISFYQPFAIRKVLGNRPSIHRHFSTPSTIGARLWT